MSDLRDARELLTGLHDDLLETDFDVYGFVGLSGYDRFNVRLLHVNDEISEGLFRTILEDALSFICDADVQPYDPHFKTDRYQAAYLNLDEISELEDFVEKVFHCVSERKFFRHSEAEVDRLKFYGTIARIGGHGPVASVRLMSPNINELDRSRFQALLFSRGMYNKMREKAFLIDGKSDFVLHDRSMFIANGTAFRKLFGFTRKIWQDVETNLETITDHVPIHNKDEFIDVCGSGINMRSKMQSVVDKPYLNRLTIDVLREAIEHSELDIEIEDDGASV